MCIAFNITCFFYKQNTPWAYNNNEGAALLQKKDVQSKKTNKAEAKCAHEIIS